MRLARLALMLVPLYFAASPTYATSFPSSVNLKHGDLIWARDKNSWVPYNYPAFTALQAFSDKPHATGDWQAFANTSAFSALRESTKSKKYDWFLDSVKWAPGHVAIVSRVGNDIEIIEAANAEEGVIKTPLDEWIDDWSDDDVFWVGHFKGLSKKQIADVVAVAKQQAVAHKPYNIKNTDLGDDSSFYCSKLIWYAVMKALDKAVDGDTNPKRVLPFSPKQLINSGSVEMVFGEADHY
jgi:hypothetical protein